MKTLFRRLIFSAVLVCATVASASAQFVALNDHLGQPVLSKSYTDINGSPYLFEDWKRGSVTVAKGTTYEGVNLMYDQVADELIFKNAKGESMVFAEPVREFSFKVENNDAVIKEQVFRNGFALVDGAKPYTFYEVLVDDKIKLLKRTSKDVVEEASYSSATKVKSFQTSTSYYIAQNDKLVKVKNDKKSVLSALSNKKAELEAYIKANRLDLKKETDLAKLLTFYNTL